MKTSLLARAKRTASNRSVRSTFVFENGAIDLASIMVGIIIIGLIGGVIAATVFAVIPWAQDNAARMQLTQVQTAQSAYSGFATSPDASASITATSVSRAAEGATYGDSEQLAQKDLLGQNENYVVVTGENSACYVAVAHSASGHLFYITDEQPKPQQFSQEETPSVACADLPLPAAVQPAPADNDDAPVACTSYHGYGFYENTRVNCSWARGANLDDTYANPEPELCAAEAEKLTYFNNDDEKRGFVDACESHGWGQERLDDLGYSLQIAQEGQLFSDPSYTVRPW